METWIYMWYKRAAAGSPFSTIQSQEPAKRLNIHMGKDIHVRRMLMCWHIKAIVNYIGSLEVDRSTC